MPQPKSPLAEVKDRFGDKSKLVAAVQKLATDDLWIDEVNDEKGLTLVSNRKLLHLHDVLSKVKEQHGSRDELIAAIMEREGRAKDEGYRERLQAWPTPRLWDRFNHLDPERTRPRGKRAKKRNRVRAS
ncbi:MAG: hypothetical protein ACOCUS_02430 [Polyangiales bacterium]